MMRIVPVPCLKDNYAYLVVAGCGRRRRSSTRRRPRRCATRSSARGCVRRPSGAPTTTTTTSAATRSSPRSWGSRSSGHVSDGARVPALTKGVDTGDTVKVGDVVARCIHIPGHTLGAVAVLRGGRERARGLHRGHALLAGCGRLFEGTPAQMHASLASLLALPGDTRVHCGHEYTESNLRFAAHVEPSNADIRRAQARAAKLRGEGQAHDGVRRSTRSGR